MEWWQPIVSFASVAVVAIAAYSLKVLMDLRTEFAGMREWRSQVDKRLDKGDTRMDRHSKALRNHGYTTRDGLRPVEEP